MGLSFFNTTPVSFHFWFVGRLILLRCHCIVSTMYYLTVLRGPPLGLPCIFPLLSSRCSIFSVGLILILSWASLAHFIPLGILDPLHSFWNPWPIPFFTFSWAFAKSFGFLWPNYHIPYFWGLLAFAPTPFTNSFLWAPPAYLYLLSTSYDFYGLTTSFSELLWAHLLFLGSFLLFYRPADYYSYHSGLIVFFSLY